MTSLRALVKLTLPPVAGATAMAGGWLLWPAKHAQPRADLAPPAAPARESWATSADGTRLRVLTYGLQDAPAIVFAHGWTCVAEVWLPQVHALVGEFRVIAYDQRGHGRSEGGGAPFQADLLAEDLSAVLAHVLGEDEQAVIAGHSMGGITIMSWAARYPEEVMRRAKAVVLTAAAARNLPSRVDLPLLGPGALDKLGALGELVVKAVVFLGGLPVPINLTPIRDSWVTRFLIRNLILCSAARDADVDLTARMAFFCPPRSRGGWFRVLAPVDVWAGVRNLKVPTTVVAGLKDRLLPASHSYEIADELAKAGWLERIVVIPEVGHMIQLEATEQYNAILRAAARQTDKAFA